MKHESGPVPPSRYNPRLAHSLARLLCLNCLLPLLLFCRFRLMRHSPTPALSSPTHRHQNKRGLGGTICTACTDRYNAHSAHHLARLLCLICLSPLMLFCRFCPIQACLSLASHHPTRPRKNRIDFSNITVAQLGVRHGKWSAL